MTKELVCICCPMGCRITVTMDGDSVTDVTGNTCNRGREYAVSEMTAPVRMVTSFVKTSEGICIPVKTASPIPKERIFDCMADIKSVTASLPVKVGDVMISDVAGTGIDVIATRSVGGL
ncbi:MAG: DUF1667 domain-containing protein [Clostridiales bacterium]|nr:DUF1667 domain-containing protein [Clostridiales bacterium]